MLHNLWQCFECGVFEVLSKAVKVAVQRHAKGSAEDFRVQV